MLEIVNEEKNEINNLTVEECINLNPDENNLFIDLSNKREITKSSCVLRTRYLPRGMLEFWIDPSSLYHKEFFNKNFLFIFYFASCWRPALTTKATNEIRFLNASHILGGYNRLFKSNGPIVSAKNYDHRISV